MGWTKVCSFAEICETKNKISEYMKWKKRRFNSDGIIALNDAQSEGGLNYFQFVK